MVNAPGTNTALLKLDVCCKGLRLDDSCAPEGAGGGLASARGRGLELVLPGGLWVDAPTAESFAQRSPYSLHRTAGRHVLRHSGKDVARVELPPRPAWYRATTASGKPLASIGALHGDHLRIRPSRMCEYWTCGPLRENCKFCALGSDLDACGVAEHSLSELVEVVRRARDESGIRYVEFSAGQSDTDGLDLLERGLVRIKQELGLWVGFQTPPARDLGRYQRLRELGLNRVAFRLGIFDPDVFQAICPGRAADDGLERYRKAIAYCAALSATGPRHEPWVTNAELIAGLEPAPSSMRGIDWIASVGAIPTLSVFRPLRGTDLEHFRPPATEDVLPVFRRLYEACMERGLPIGSAPRRRMSLAMQPEECRPLSRRRFRWRSLKLKASAIASARQRERRPAPRTPAQA